MEEVWKPISQHEGYSVSNTGKIRGPRKVLTGFISKCGYQVISISDGSKVIKKSVHRLVADAFIENPDNKCDVDHINRVKTDNRVENLRWATPSENNFNNSRQFGEMYGLRWHARGSGYYEIRLGGRGKEKSYGTARTLEEAKQKRDEVLRQNL
jgi:hypothetical protein